MIKLPLSAYLEFSRDSCDNEQISFDKVMNKLTLLQGSYIISWLLHFEPICKHEGGQR